MTTIRSRYDKLILRVTGFLSVPVGRPNREIWGEVERLGVRMKLGTMPSLSCRKGGRGRRTWLVMAHLVY